MAKASTLLITLVTTLLLTVGPALLVSASEPIARRPGYYPGEDVPLVQLTGSVTDSEGNPVPYAQINAYFPERGTSYWGSTDEQGNYKMDTAIGSATIYVQAKGYEQATSELTIPDSGATHTFVMKAYPKPTANLVGHIVDGLGKPIAGASVGLSYDWSATEKDGDRPVVAGEDKRMSSSYYPCCYSDPQREYQHAVTDENGKFSITHYGGPYLLNINARGFIPASQPVTLVDGELTTADQTLKPLPKDSVTITGVVRDAQTQLPIAGANVEAYGLQWGKYYQSVMTGEDGKYTFVVVPGYTRITASVYQYCCYAMPAVSEEKVEPASDSGSGEGSSGEATMIAPEKPMPSTSPGIPSPPPMKTPQREYFPNSAYVTGAEGSTHHLDIALDAKPKPTVVVTGYVIDETTRKGITGAYVSINNLQTGEYGSAVTDETGSYKFLVNPGYLAISASPQGYFERTNYFQVGAVAGAVKQVLEVTPGQTTWVDWWSQENPQYSTMRDSDGNVTSFAPPSGSPQMAANSAEMEKMNLRGSGNNGAAAYAGSGGGLPPYSDDAMTGRVEPVETQTTGGDKTPVAKQDQLNPSDGTTKKKVPGLEIVAALGALAAIALALRRR